MKKKKSIFAVGLACMFLLYGCGDKEKSSSVSVSDTGATTAVTDTATGPASSEVVSTVCNPLTGECGYNENAVGKRAVAVMVNNLKAALPQYGIAAADIIYEIPVEGGITRLMAVYADYTAMPDVCSVRSCRYYYPILAYGMDAIYCHWGSDQTIALETLNRLGIDHIDGGGAGNGVIFFRDEERAAVYSSEHTGYLSGAAMQTAIESTFALRTESTAGDAFKFLPQDAPAVPVGVSCSSVNLPFSDSYYSTFTYDTTTRTYLKQHSGSPHMDGRTGTQLAFTNVLVLQTNVATRSDGYLMDVGLNSGTGYYISNGAAQEINWVKASEDTPICIYDTLGTEISVNAGKTYIGLIGTSRMITISK